MPAFETHGPARVEVELLGVARLLARREAVVVPVEKPLPLGEFIRTLAAEVPALVGTVFSEDGELLGGHVFSRGGAELLRSPHDLIHPGDRLLLLSTAAGG